jgi:serine/threonine protein kinase
MVLENCKFSLRKFARLRRYESFEGLTEKDVIKVLRDTCFGLKGLHMLGVVHLDIKPENILCSRDENFKISDFGLARRLCDFSDEGEQEIPEGDERYLA